MRDRPRPPGQQDQSDPTDPAGRQAVVVDALLGFTVFAVVAIAIGAGIGGGDLPAVVAYGFASVLGLLMLFRRRWPLAVLLLTAVLLIAYYVVDLPVIGLAVPVAAALYSAAVFDRTRWAVGTAAALVVVSTVARLAEGQDPAFLLGYELVSTVAIMGAAIALGDGVRQRAEGARQRELIAVLDAQAREAESAELLARERARIARDLHDAVGHHLSVVSLHTSVAAEALEEGSVDAPVARAELRHVAQAAREGLRDLRSTVRALREPRGGQGAGDGIERVAGLAHLDDLVASVRAAGLDAEVTGEGGPGLPGLVDATAYWVVQEALTNTLRHARAEAAEVALERAEGTLTVTVTDDGTGPLPGEAFGERCGSGLAGMRERVRMVEGTLEAGPVPGRGFRVRARLLLGGGA
ncbi:sensor histidine kinase [Nocardiopsis sp. L17-MgMaSL7]|uniref:sensor histidine kinase n=1 Tax=Nocardiopsis sp. L17-MgMaSL7 TaxID=1938893 RepID=UPI000D70FD86|nr:sensor histidine kinase [Nocardiopsis sp. L17-MgMaSL7]PWV47864.1 signal transduction histidine kinase [Nocardiopsis sp. L17-MgMaSL7]